MTLLVAPTLAAGFSSMADPDEFGDYKPAAIKATNVCWGCQKKQAKGDRFVFCPKCKDEGFVPTPFCSEGCYKKSWPRHNKWHKKQAKSIRDYWKVKKSKPTKEEEEIVASLEEYEALIIKAYEMITSTDFNGAKKVLRKAIKLDTRRPEAFMVLGIVFDVSAQESEGLDNFEQCCARWAFVVQTDFLGEEHRTKQRGKEEWAGCVEILLKRYTEEPFLIDQNHCGTEKTGC